VIEFEIIAHMMYKGMVKEAMGIPKAVRKTHARYGGYQKRI
jgi:uncharacterized protein (DUF608 family)